MTLQGLINKLEKLKLKIGKRAQVTISKQGMKNLDNEDFTHTSLQSVSSESILWSINDSHELKNGSQRIRTVVVLNGE